MKINSASFVHNRIELCNPLVECMLSILHLWNILVSSPLLRPAWCCRPG